MTNEEKKAIERMKNVYVKNVHTFHDELGTVLNLIKKQQKEIGKLHNIMEELNEEKEKNNRIKELESDKEIKNKIIDRMAEYINKLDIDEDICTKNIINPELCNEQYSNCKECIKQYFENLAKESGEIDEY